MITSHKHSKNLKANIIQQLPKCVVDANWLFSFKVEIK